MGAVDELLWDQFGVTGGEAGNKQIGAISRIIFDKTFFVFFFFVLR